MAQFLFANNATSTLALGITSSATTLTVSSGAGALYPLPSTGQQFALTLIDAATGLLNEIVYVTARSGDVMTIVRAQEGTTPRAWLAGDAASNLLTENTAASFAQDFQVQNQTLTYFVDSGSANAYVITPAPAVSALIDGMQFAFRAANSNTTASTLTIGSSATKSIVYPGGTAVAAATIVAGYVYEVTYDSTEDLYQLVSLVSTAPTQTANDDSPKLANTFYVDRAAATTLSSAETFATGAANTALASAETFATGAANTAQSNAETFATGAANTAEAAAIAASRLGEGGYSQQKFTPASGTTYDNTLSFTAPCDGVVRAASITNMDAQPVGCVNLIDVNGIQQFDDLHTSMTNVVTVAVSSGEALTITAQFQCGSSGGTFGAISLTCEYVFIPGP